MTPQGILSEPKDTFEIDSAAMIKEDVDKENPWCCQVSGTSTRLPSMKSPMSRTESSKSTQLSSSSSWTAGSWSDGDPDESSEQIEDDDVDFESSPLSDAPSKYEKMIPVKTAPHDTLKFLMDYERALKDEEGPKSLQPVTLSEDRAFAMLFDVLKAFKSEPFQVHKDILLARAVLIRATVYVKGFSKMALSTFLNIIPKYGFQENFEGIIQMKHALKALLTSAVQDESDAKARELSRMLKQIDNMPPTIDGYIFDRLAQDLEPAVGHMGAVAWPVPEKSVKISKQAVTTMFEFKVPTDLSANMRQVTVSSDGPPKVADVKQALIEELGCDSPSQLEIVKESDVGEGWVRRADSEPMLDSRQVLVTTSEEIWHMGEVAWPVKDKSIKISSSSANMRQGLIEELGYDSPSQLEIPTVGGGWVRCAHPGLVMTSQGFDAPPTKGRSLFKIMQVIDDLTEELDVSRYLGDFSL